MLKVVCLWLKQGSACWRKIASDMYYRLGKRLLDLAITIPALIILLPVLAFVALLVRIRLGSSVLFRQQRPGLYGKPFTIYKFRTMTNARDAQGNLLPDGQRLTCLGRFLRSTSLDELPELFNVLKGDMSLVGPRPLMMQYLERYTPQQMCRHEVKPGVTGWAQVNGRNAITWEQRFVLDVWYVDHWSLWLDLRIIALTVWKVFAREGISQPGQATMEEFVGAGCADVLTASDQETG
jgi:sugar transferase EpsL